MCVEVIAGALKDVNVIRRLPTAVRKPIRTALHELRKCITVRNVQGQVTIETAMATVSIGGTYDDRACLVIGYVRGSSVFGEHKYRPRLKHQSESWRSAIRCMRHEAGEVSGDGRNYYISGAVSPLNPVKARNALINLIIFGHGRRPYRRLHP